MPCEVPRSVSSGAPKSQQKGKTNISGSAEKVQKHSASLLSTCSISFSGSLDGPRIKGFLDDILFGNGARVGGGYRQPNITYVDLLDKPSIVAQPSERGQEEIFVFSSAAVVPMDSGSRKVVNSTTHGVQSSDDMMIFRIKGVLHISGEEYLQILQGVFDVFEVKPSSFLVGCKEDLSQGLNRIVVIGRNIDREKIEEGFLSCLL